MITIENDVPGREQESCFMNATLNSLDSGLAVSVAVELPPQMQDASEEDLERMLREDFKPLSDIGYNIEIQMGPDE